MRLSPQDRVPGCRSSHVLFSEDMEVDEDAEEWTATVDGGFSRAAGVRNTSGTASRDPT